MQNRCSKKLENHCQNGSQNELKSFKISLLRRPLAIDSVIFGLLERCQNNMFFCTSLEAQKTRKVGQGCGKEAPWGQRPCTRDPIFEDLGPWAPTRAKPVKSSKVLKLASWLVGTEKLVLSRAKDSDKIEPDSGST